MGSDLRWLEDQFSQRRSNPPTYINQLFVQEVVSKQVASRPTGQSGGLNVNVVPKMAAMRFGAPSLANTPQGSPVGSNLTDEFAQGLTRSDPLFIYYDAGRRIWRSDSTRGQDLVLHSFRQVGFRHHACQRLLQQADGTPFYEEISPGRAIKSSKTTRLQRTGHWAATEKHKLAFTHSDASHCLCWFNLQTGNMSPEAAININYRPNRTQLA